MVSQLFLRLAATAIATVHPTQAFQVVFPSIAWTLPDIRTMFHTAATTCTHNTATPVRRRATQALAIWILPLTSTAMFSALIKTLMVSTSLAAASPILASTWSPSKLATRSTRKRLAIRGRTVEKIFWTVSSRPSNLTPLVTITCLVLSKTRWRTDCSVIHSLQTKQTLVPSTQVWALPTGSP